MNETQKYPHWVEGKLSSILRRIFRTRRAQEIFSKRNNFALKGTDKEIFWHRQANEFLKDNEEIIWKCSKKKLSKGLGRNKVLWLSLGQADHFSREQKVKVTKEVTNFKIVYKYSTLIISFVPAQLNLFSVSTASSKTHSNYNQEISLNY